VDHSIAAQIVVIGLVASAPHVRMLDAQSARPSDVRARKIALDPSALWQRFAYEQCHAVVPGSWHGDSEAGSVSAPDGSSLSIRMFRMASWIRHKAQIREAFVYLNLVHEDSDRRLWFEFGTGQHIQHYISSTDGSHICSGLLEIRTRTPASEITAHRIADSIGPDPERPVHQ
jgi:hypothetical protein